MPFENLLAHTRGGFFLIDELHQEFHAMYRSLIILAPPKFLGLSATFDSDSGDIQARYDDIVPPDNVINPLDKDPYKDVTSIEYRIGFTSNLRYISYYTKGYSHVDFEKSIMRSPKLKMAYYKMIVDGIDEYWFSRGTDKGKLLVYFATINMINDFIRLLEKIYPNYKVSRFVAGDPKENLLDGEIRVSTLGKSGTAVDIPDLRTVIMTVSLSSKDGNLQALGRLRKIHKVKTEFVYYWSSDIREHEKYHFSKFNLFRGSYKSWITDLYRRELTPIYNPNTY
jgi:hypothetical protein